MSSVCKISLQASCPSFSLIFSLDVLGGLTVSFFSLFSPLFCFFVLCFSLSQTHTHTHTHPFGFVFHSSLSFFISAMFSSLRFIFVPRMLLSDNTLFLFLVCRVFCGLWLPWCMFMWEVFSKPSWVFFVLSLFFFPPSLFLFSICCVVAFCLLG